MAKEISAGPDPASHEPAKKPSASRSMVKPADLRRFKALIEEARATIPEILRSHRAIMVAGQALKEMYETGNWRESFATWDELCRELCGGGVYLDEKASLQLMSLADAFASLPHIASSPASPAFLELHKRLSQLPAEELFSAGPSRIEIAKALLRKRLADGSHVPFSTIDEEATREGISTATLRRAKKALKVESKRKGFGRKGKYVWFLAPGKH